MILNCARRTRASCCLLCIVTISRSRELPDCPSLRASDEHSFIVRVLRARRMVWQLPCRLLLYIFQANPSTNSEAFACFGNSLVESGIVFKPKVKPIIFGLKANESPGRLSMACDHHLFLRGEPQIFRQVIFHFREPIFFMFVSLFLRAMLVAQTLLQSPALPLARILVGSQVRGRTRGKARSALHPQ